MCVCVGGGGYTFLAPFVFLAPTISQVGQNVSCKSFFQSHMKLVCSFGTTFKIVWNMGPRDPWTKAKRPIGTKFVRDMPWRLLGQFSNFHDWKAIWKPFGFRRTLAWSFSLDVPEGPKRARVWGVGCLWGSILSGLWYMPENTGWFLRLWYIKAMWKLMLQVCPGLICL